MTEKTLRDKPVTSAQELHRFLRLLPQKISLSSHQNAALNRDIKTLESLISMLNEAGSKDTWREVWSMTNDMNKTFGGYVGDELGQNLNQLFDALWRDILESYSKITE